MHTNGTPDDRCPRRLGEPEPPRDDFGFYYGTDSWTKADGTPFTMTFRLTECCQAAVTYHDEWLCCKCCWDEVDPAYDSPAVLNGAEPVVTEPIRYTLPKE